MPKLELISKGARAAPPIKNKTENNQHAERMEIPPPAELFLLGAIGKYPTDPIFGGKRIFGGDIPDYVEYLSGGRVSMPSGTLYSSLRRLRKKGLIDYEESPSPEGGGRRKYYFFTATGEQVYSFARETLGAFLF